MKKKNPLLTCVAILGLSIFTNGQSLTKSALFLGNSYTAYNNLPLMVADVASSMGDSLIFNSNTPGGYRLLGHSTDATSLGMIALGTWDYIVLQEQSQFPSFPDYQVEADVFPYARILDSIINANNPCAETVFYMTWGRKNGDASNCASWPPVCTYSGMDSLLNLRYRMMADSNDAIVSPVGAVWNYIRQNYPSIELYQTDESHPSVAGTYAAACSFYTALFRKDPTLITFNSTLASTDAADIRAATKLILYDSLMNWHIGEYEPMADFSSTDLGSGQITFTNNSSNATTYLWDFGDGNTSTANNPSHTYSMNGSYTVKLLATKCDEADSTTQSINVIVTNVQHPENTEHLINIYPNPTANSFILRADAKLFSSEYNVYDYTGKSVLSGKINSRNTIIELNEFPSGIFILRVGENREQTLKVLKE